MSRRKDRERAKTLVFRDGKLITHAEAEKLRKPRTVEPQMPVGKAVAEAMKEAGVRDVSDRLAKIRKQIES